LLARVTAIPKFIFEKHVVKSFIFEDVVIISVFVLLLFSLFSPPLVEELQFSEYSAGKKFWSSAFTTSAGGGSLYDNACIFYFCCLFFFLCCSSLRIPKMLACDDQLINLIMYLG
jgi:hypothetical protein